MLRERYCVLWMFLGPLLLTVVYGLNDCLPSREVYVNLNLGPPEDVPVEFDSGTWGHNERVCYVIEYVISYYITGT